MRQNSVYVLTLYLIRRDVTKFHYPEVIQLCIIG